jgi:hypothetical protein
MTKKQKGLRLNEIRWEIDSINFINEMEGVNEERQAKINKLNQEKLNLYNA